MCDFKPGDEVVCVSSRRGILAVGANYTVASVGDPAVSDSGLIATSVRLRDGPDFYGQHFTRDDGSSYRWIGWAHYCFRKVQRRKTDLSIEQFLTIKPGFEEPKRVPEKQKEKAK